MNRIALQMLLGDGIKYLGMIFGVAFSTLLIAQQASLFLGLVARASTAVNEVVEANVWVMDTRALSVTSASPLSETAVYRVRGVPGVEWAVPLLFQNSTIKTDTGRLEQVTLFGLDNAAMVGLPKRVVAGDASMLNAPGAIGMDAQGYRFLFGDRPFEPGVLVELNDARANIVVLFDSGALFTSQISIFTRFTNAVELSSGGQNRVTFVVARAQLDRSPEAVARDIESMTGLKALSRKEFSDQNARFVIGNTGIPISFGTVVALGIIVGVVVVALTFSLFIRDNLRQFGALKAIGLSNQRLLGMVLESLH